MRYNKYRHPLIKWLLKDEDDLEKQKEYLVMLEEDKQYIRPGFWYEYAEGGNFETSEEFLIVINDAQDFVRSNIARLEEEAEKE